jgi:hypothetical protein
MTKDEKWQQEFNELVALLDRQIGELRESIDRLNMVFDRVQKEREKDNKRAERARVIYKW